MFDAGRYVATIALPPGHAMELVQTGMSEFFELLDTASGNVLDDFDTEQEALAALRLLSHEHGGDAVEELALLRFADDHPTLIAMGKELVALVEATADHQDRLHVAVPLMRARTRTHSLG